MMAAMTTVTFLGTGNFLTPGRYWNSFVFDGNVLVEPAPTVLPHLRRCGLNAGTIEVVVISHFHADHTFGWPFFLLEVVQQPRTTPLFVVGPPGVAQYLADMNELGGVPNIQRAAEATVDLRFVEVDETWQDAGPLRFRAVRVDHVAHLECYGYLFERDGRTISYSGDTRPCPGLDELTAASDVLIVECNGAHADKTQPVTHMDEDALVALRDRHPDVPFILTHIGANVDTSHIADVTVPEDFQRLTI